MRHHVCVLVDPSTTSIDEGWIVMLHTIPGEGTPSDESGYTIDLYVSVPGGRYGRKSHSWKERMQENWGLELELGVPLGPASSDALKETQSGPQRRVKLPTSKPQPQPQQFAYQNPTEWFYGWCMMTKVIIIKPRNEQQQHQEQTTTTTISKNDNQVVPAFIVFRHSAGRGNLANF